MKTSSSKHAHILLYALAILLLAGGIYRYNYLPDDTFVTLRYAHNAIRGEGLVWNSGEKVEGYTNFFWLLVIMATGKLGAPLLGVARFLSTVFSLFTLILVYKYSFPPSENRKGDISPSMALSRMLPVLILCAAPPFLVWTMSGTEIPLFTLLLLAGYLLIEQNEKPLAGLSILGLSGFVRPEGVLFFAAGFLILFSQQARRRAVVFLGTSIVFLYILYATWKIHYYNAILPNTFYAKTGPIALLLSNGTQYLLRFLVAHGYLLPVGIVLARKSRKKNIPVAVPAAFVLSHWIAILVLGGDWMPHFRLLLPTLPIVVLLASRGIGAVIERTQLPLVATFAVFLSALPGTIDYELFLAERTSVTAYKKLGERLAEILPPGTTLACGSIGAIGYYSDLPVIDILGLTDRWIARYGKIVSGQPGHFKTDGEYILERSPDLLLLGNIWIHRGEQGREEMRIKIQEREITQQRSFEEKYRFVNIPLGQGFYLSCFKRVGFFLPLGDSPR